MGLRRTIVARSTFAGTDLGHTVPNADERPGAQGQPRDQLHRIPLEARGMNCAQTLACLRQARKSRRLHTRGAARRGTIPNIVSIHMHPPEIELRGMPG